MDNLPAEILIRIFDKSRLSDQLVSHRLINTKFRKLIPTKISRIQRLHTTDLVAVSKKLVIFSHRDSAFYHSLHEDPDIESAYANLLLYFCNLCGTSLKCISFTATLFLDSATMEKLAMMCPNIIEITVGSADWRVRYLGGDVQLLFNYVYLALPRFPQLKILRIISAGATDLLLQPIVARLRLQKLRTSGSEAPILTADPNLLEELLIPAWLKSSQYRAIQNSICEVFPNLRRHYMEKKHWNAFERTEENYRRLHMLRGSSWIGGRDLCFIDERLFLDFPYLQSMDVVMTDDRSCDRFIRALQSSRNWKALKIIFLSRFSTEKCKQLLQALFYTTAVQLKSLTLDSDLVLKDAFQELLLHFDYAGSMVVFDKTLRHCEMRGPGMFLFASKIANECSRLKSLNVWDYAEYMQPESGLKELLEIALGRFEQANLRNLLKLSLNTVHSTAYGLINCLRGNRLQTMQLRLDGTDREISAVAHCTSLLREDVFPYLRNLSFTTYNVSMLSDIMLNILRNLPGLRWLWLELSSERDEYDIAPPVQLERLVWQPMADHVNLQFCSMKLRFDICLEDTVKSLCNAVIARKKVTENGRVLPWLFTKFDSWCRASRKDHHRMGKNAYCFVSVNA